MGGGLILGDHDYREHIAAAAMTTLPKAVAERFCGAHLPSARTTHLLEATGNLAVSSSWSATRRARRRPSTESAFLECQRYESGNTFRYRPADCIMNNLAVNVFGDVAIATFHGDFSGIMEGHPITARL